MNYASFEGVLVPQDNEKQHAGESHTNKYRKHVACSYGCKLICTNDKFSKSFRYYLGEDAVYNFINSMVEESKYFTDEKCFNKELLMTKKDNENFENSNKGCIYDHVYVEVRDHSLITGKYRGSVHSD